MSSKSGKTTLKDLSALTGVSATAISHILNDRLGHVRASEATQRRVLSAARELGYVPRLQARSMATRRSYAIGVVCSLQQGPLDPYSASYFANALCGVEEVCREANHHCIFVASALGDPGQFVEPRLMKDGSVDGVVLIGLASRRVATQLLAMGLPCMQVGNSVDPSIGIDSVYSDIDGGVESVCRRLAELGHRRVEFALPAGPGSEKHLTYFRSLGKRIAAGFEPRAVTIASPVPTLDDGRARARAALALPASQAPTAFICTMRQAMGLVWEMAAAGRSFPSDYSVVVLASEDADPAHLGPEQRRATTILIPTHEVARQAALALFERLNAGDVQLPRPTGSKVPCLVRDGQSCGPCPTA
jgi:LacI family transcriptional regulator